MTDQTPINTTGAVALPNTPPDQPTKTRWDTRTFLAVWMSISMFGLVVMCWWKTPDPANQIFNTLISIYGATGFVTVIQWWMGSSKGSEDKTQALADVAKS